MFLVRALCVSAASFLLVSLVHASAVYKWTDDKGVVQYTDSPPEGRKFERMQVGGAGARSRTEFAEDSGEGDAAEGADGAVPEGPTPAQRRIETMKANCDTARKNLETLERFEVVTVDADGDGTPETLDAEARDKAIADNRELVRQYCVD